MIYLWRELMSEIDAVEAMGSFSALLDRVARGETIVITRDGTAIAKLTPAQPRSNRAQAKAAAQRIRELAETMNLGPFDWEEWKKYRDAGRR